MYLKHARLLLLLGLVAKGNASVLEAATFGAKVQIQMKKSEVAACGAVIFGLENKTTGLAYSFNGSVLLMANGAGLVKARISQIEAGKIFSKSFKLGDLKTLPAKDIWLKANNSKATSPLQGVQESEDVGYSIYQSESTENILKAILIGDEFQIGFHVDGKNSGNVMFGKANMSEEEKFQLAQCIKELITQMDNSSNKKGR